MFLDFNDLDTLFWSRFQYLSFRLHPSSAELFKYSSFFLDGKEHLIMEICSQMNDNYQMVCKQNYL